MASGTLTTRPPSENVAVKGRYEEFIQKRLEHTRRQVRLVDVATGAMLLAVASLAFFLAVAVLDQWVFAHGLSFIARLGLFTLWVGAALFYVWRHLVPPLANRINPVFAAQTIEHDRPTLKNSLINFLLLRSHPQDVAPVVFQALEQRAASDLMKVPVDHAVDRGRVVYLACALAAMVGIFALYLAFSPKNPLVSAARVLWPWANVSAPTRVQIEEVAPGDKTVFNDDRETISAMVTGLRDGEEVALLVSTADGQVIDDRMVMTRVDDANQFRCDLPAGSSGFQQDTFYRITAGDCTTPQYKLDVQIAPTITIDKIDYHFPPYTGKKDITIEKQGDIKALDGTKVTIHATANMEIQQACIDVNCSGLQSKPMKVDGRKATGEFTLALDDDNKPVFYSYQFIDLNGKKIRRPIHYNIDVERDFPPIVEIVEPRQEEVTVAEGGQLKVRVHAFDPDFALRNVTLHAQREVELQGEPKPLALPVLLNRPNSEKAFEGPLDDDSYTFRPAALELKAGDRVTLWATADDNKEPRPNQSKSAPRIIKIVGEGQNGGQDPQNPQPGDATQQPNSSNPDRDGNRGKAGSPQGDPGNKDKSPDQHGERNPDGNSDHAGGGNKPNDPQRQDAKDKGQKDSGGPGKPDASSEPGNGQNKAEPNNAEADDQPNHRRDPDTERTDAVKEILRHQEEEEKKQRQNQPDSPGAEQKPDQKPDGNPSEHSQGSPQQGGSDQKDNKGEKNSQGKGADSKDNQGGSDSGKQPEGGKQDSGKQQAQGSGTDQKKDQDGNAGGQQPQGGKPDAGGQQPKGNSQDPNGQGTSKASPEKSNGGASSGGNPQQGSKENGKQGSGDPSSANPSSSHDGAKGSEPKAPNGQKIDQGASSQPKSNSTSGGDKQQGTESTAGNPKPEKSQSGSEQGKNESAGGNAPKPADQKPGSQGGDDHQLAQGGPKPNEKKPSDGAGSESPNSPGQEKPDPNSKAEKSGAQGAEQGSKPKKEKTQDGGSPTGGGEKPQSGQGSQSGSKGGQKPDGNKPPVKQGGTADGDQRQQDPGKTGEPTPRDSHGAPEPQDRGPGQPKTGDAREGATPPDKAQSPSTSKHDSDSSGESRGDRPGGGGAGGGQKNKKAGTGAAGDQKPAENGGSVSEEKGNEATGTKAGDQVRSGDRTGSSQKQTGEGNGKKSETPDKQTAKDNAQKPQGDAAENSSQAQNAASGGKAGAKSPQQAGEQGTGVPAGGSQPGNQATPPDVPAESPAKEDAANTEFSKKQVDLALEHLRQQKDKSKSDLLDRLGWTKEEAEKFMENIKKLKDSAQQPGGDGESGKKAYNEFLKNLDLRPRGTRIQGGQTRTDNLQGVRDDGQSDVPSEWAEQYRAFSRATSGKK